jgi:type IV pilus assembly protein PilA
MLKQTLQRGFTLIELLVVIAIIGILAAVVLTSLSGAQEGAQNSNVQQSLGSTRSAAQLSYNENQFSYASVCTDGEEVDTTLDGLNDSLSFITAVTINGTPAATAIGCNDSATAYAISAPLLEDGATGSNYWCVDSTGFQGARTNHLGNGDVVCPSSRSQ